MTQRVRSAKNRFRCVLDYYFLSQVKKESNFVEIKVISPSKFQYSAILLPCILALIVLGIFYRQMRLYNTRKLELQRNEMSMINLTSRDSILKLENTLKERLENISKKTNENMPISRNEKINDNRGEFEG